MDGVAACLFRERSQGGVQGALSGPGTVFHQGAGQVGGVALGQQPGAERRQAFHAHVVHPGPAVGAVRALRPGRVRLPVRRGEDQGLGVVAVRQRNAGVGAAGQGGGDAGHDFIGNAVPLQVLQFLAAAAKDHGVAAFQAHHAASLAGVRHHQGMDAGLGGFMRAARGLAHVDHLRVAPRQRQDGGADQAVGQDHVGLVQGAQAAQGQQARVAGAGADQQHPARRGRIGGRQGLVQQGFRFVGAAAPQGAQDGAVQQPVVEIPARAQLRPGLTDGRPLAPGQRGQGAQGRVEHRFDALAQAPGDHGRGAARGDGDGERRPVHDGRHLDAGQFRIVHDVAEQAAGRGGVRDPPVLRAVAGGRYGQPGLVQQGRVEFPQAQLDLAGLGARQHLGMACAGADDDPGARRAQQGDLALGHQAGPHDDDRAALQVGEQREVVHAAPALRPGAAMCGSRASAWMTPARTRKSPKPSSATRSRAYRPNNSSRLDRISASVMFSR
ncbi:hypothetical protein CDEN61S_02678 [Castellaniella denitrificans]